MKLSELPKIFQSHVRFPFNCINPQQCFRKALLEGTFLLVSRFYPRSGWKQLFYIPLTSCGIMPGSSVNTQGIMIHIYMRSNYELCLRQGSTKWWRHYFWNNRWRHNSRIDKCRPASPRLSMCSCPVGWDLMLTRTSDVCRALSLSSLTNRPFEITDTVAECGVGLGVAAALKALKDLCQVSTISHFASVNG